MIKETRDREVSPGEIHGLVVLLFNFSLGPLSLPVEVFMISNPS